MKLQNYEQKSAKIREQFDALKKEEPEKLKTRLNLSWSNWGFGEYACRYYQIKFTLTNNNAEKVGRLKYLKSRATVQYYSENHEDQAYAGSGTNTLNLGVIYYKRFGFNVMEQGDYYAEVVAKNFVAGGTSSIEYRLRDNTTNALTSGTVDIVIRGY